MRDFECDACYGMLPGFPCHGEHGAYCSQYCRDAPKPHSVIPRPPTSRNARTFSSVSWT